MPAPHVACLQLQTVLDTSPQKYSNIVVKTGTPFQSQIRSNMLSRTIAYQAGKLNLHCCMVVMPNFNQLDSKQWTNCLVTTASANGIIRGARCSWHSKYSHRGTMMHRQAYTGLDIVVIVLHMFGQQNHPNK